MRTDTSKLLLLATIVWCNSAALGQRQEAPSASLSSDDVETYARLLQMADTRSFDSSLVRKALAGGSGPVRAEASRAVAQLVPTHHDEAVPVLRTLLTDRDTAVAANAAFGLGCAHDTASVPALVESVRRSASGAQGTKVITVSRAAAWALGEIGEAARTPLSLLLGEHLPPEVTTSLLLAEAKLQSPDIAAIVSHLHDRTPSTVWGAAYTIARRPTPDGIRALLGLDLPKTEWTVRTEIAHALSAPAVPSALRQDALQMLSTLLHDDYSQVRIEAVRSAATYGRAARGPVTQTARDEDANVRVATAQSVGAVMGRDPDDWQDLWAADTSFVYRRSLVEASVQAGAPLPELARWRTSADWRYRAASVSAWRFSPDTLQAKTVALLASYDRDGRVRAAAYDLLAAMDADRRDTVVQSLLHAAEADSDVAAREAIPWYRRAPTALDSESLHHPIDWYKDVVRDIVVPALEGPLYSATMVTDRGTIRLALLSVQAPLTVRNFIVLANRGFFNGLRFHRVVPGFVAQGGDPRGDGNGGPGYTIRDELNRQLFTRGAVGMALSGPDTGGSQYFLTLSPQPHLSGHYPLFARVASGLAAMDALVEGDLIKSVTVP